MGLTVNLYGLSSAGQGNVIMLSSQADLAVAFEQDLCMSCGFAGLLSGMEGKPMEGYRQLSCAPGNSCCAAAIVQQGLSAHHGQGGGSSARSYWIVSLSGSKEEMENAL